MVQKNAADSGNREHEYPACTKVEKSNDVDTCEASEEFACVVTFSDEECTEDKKIDEVKVSLKSCEQSKKVAGIATRSRCSDGMFRVQKYKTTMKDCGDEAKKDGDELKVIANVCRSKKMYKCHFTDGNEEETTTMLSEAEKQRLATLILRITLLAMSALFLV